MLTLDPVKLLIIGVVALLVLGPDKLPAAVRKGSSLLRDLQRLRASLHEQVQETVGGHPLVTEITGARDSLVRLRQSVDPRQALYRSIGLGEDDVQPGSRSSMGQPQPEVVDDSHRVLAPSLVENPVGDLDTDPGQN